MQWSIKCWGKWLVKPAVTRAIGIAAAIGIVLGGGLAGLPAAAQAPPLMPIAELDDAAIRYITRNGSVIANLGMPDADRLIGRAVPCRFDAAGRYTLASDGAYPVPTGTRYSANASALGEPLAIMSQGKLSGQIGAGPVSLEAADDALVRLDIAEAVRLSVDTRDENGPLNAVAIAFLDRLTDNLPRGYGHWCIITSASVWNVRYEAYRKRRVIFGLTEGVWLATGSGNYHRDASATVPYQVVTIGITPYAVGWVQSQAASGSFAPPPPAAVVAAIEGDLTAQALTLGEAVAAVAEASLIQDRLARDTAFAAQVEAIRGTQ